MSMLRERTRPGLGIAAKPSNAQDTYFQRDPFPIRRGDVRLSSRDAFSSSVILVVPYWP